MNRKSTAAISSAKEIDSNVTYCSIRSKKRPSVMTDTRLLSTVTMVVARPTLVRFAPVYIKCGAYRKKEEFGSLFREFVLGHRSENLRDLAMKYQHKVNQEKARPIESIVRSEDIGHDKRQLGS